MSFSVAQTFTVDPSVVLKATQVNITEVQLYFRAKPRITGNKSGIDNPGVQVGIVPTQFGIPLLGQTGVDTNIVWARQEWGSIHVTADASIATRFRFAGPEIAFSGTQYAIIVKYDGDEDFLLWTNKTGDNLVGTTNKSPGVGGKFVGNLYTYISPSGALTGTGFGYSNSSSDADSAVVPSISSQVSTSVQLSQEFLLSAWKPIDNADLKFKVSVARYSHTGVPVSTNTAISAEPSIIVYGSSSNNFQVISNNVLRVTAPSSPVEFIQYDRTVSNDDPINFGEQIFQDQPYYTGGKPAPATCAVVNGDVIVTGNTSFILANGSSFSWDKLFPSRTGQMIVFTSLNHDGAGLHRVNVRQVLAANAQLLCVDEACSFTNATARFFIAPTGRITSKLRSYGVNNLGSTAGKMADILVVSSTSANLACRFVNNCVNSYSIGAAGTGYSNNDIFNVLGFENVGAEVSGGYRAVANVATNGSGVIQALSFTNTGAGFVNGSSITYSISNNSGGTSNGSGASITATFDTTLKTESSGGGTYFKGAKVINLDALQITPSLDIQTPGGTSHNITNRSLYHSIASANTFSGRTYFVNDDATLTDFNVENGKLHNFPSSFVPSIVSRSNQFVVRFANGAVANDAVIGTQFSNTATYFFDVASNNDFSAVSFGNAFFTSTYARYIINNDYTNEHTNYGNAWAKHVGTKINFADGLEAEDLLTYITGYRPSGTDFKVYCRIHNALDDEPFELKDWTLLEQTDGLGVFSSPNNPTDMKEFTYNFRAYPNTDLGFANPITTTLNSNAIVGSGTLFNSYLAANDVVKISQPLFPNNYMIAVVATVSSDTAATLTEPVTNNGIVGTGMKFERIGYRHQAFNDVLNSNVVAYYNGSMARFDGFDTMQLKVIFLSNNDHLIPKIDDCRSVGVSS